jgi:hypothetical protein
LAFITRPASNAPTKRLTRIFAQVGINPHLGELRAEGMHRIALHLLTRLRLTRRLDELQVTTPK